MKSKSATASSLADLHQLQQQHHHHQQQQLFNSALANSSQFGAGNSGNGQQLTAAHILNYAAQLSGGVQKGLETSNWDPAVALQMSTALFGASPASSASSDTLAQLNAASQLIAASLLQQQTQNTLQESHWYVLLIFVSRRTNFFLYSEPTNRKSSSKQQASHSPTSSSVSAATPTPLVCSICGQTSRDQSDYEGHLLTHISHLAHLSGSSQGPGSQASAYQCKCNWVYFLKRFNQGFFIFRLKPPENAELSLAHCPPNSRLDCTQWSLFQLQR